jgi:outer membrane protein assembly factor BamB
LPLQLAQSSQLRIILLQQDPARLERWRQELVKRGLHGGRVVVHHGSNGSLPFPPYVFDLVIDQRLLAEDGSLNGLKERLRVAKPCGGLALWKLPDGPEDFTQTVSRTVDRHGVVSADGDWLRIRRGRLPDSRDWTHNYATPANTYCSEDRRVRGPFDVLWYGEPGPRDRIDRHATPPMPLVVGATIFTLGPETVLAYDIYNGVCRWRRELSGARRSHLPIDSSNLAADQTSLFVVVQGGQCFRLDANSGETIQTYDLPDRSRDGKSRWAWIARTGNRLFGSRAEKVADSAQLSQQTSDAVFSLNVSTGAECWIYRGGGIDHDGIAVADNRVFLIDRNLDNRERQQALTTAREDSAIPDRPPRDRRGVPIAPDLRKLVVLDSDTGKVLWEKPWNLSDITLDDTVVQGRSGIACMVADGVLIVHGTGSLGHPHREFLVGEFDRRALYAFDATNGRYLWGGRRGYRKRPIIVGDYIYAEPFAWHLRSGNQLMTSNPVSGKLQAFDFHRGYIGCGHLLASGTSLFGAKNGVACCNLDELSGFTSFAGMALACGLDAVPAGGVFVVPEGRSGCTCDTPIHTSISFYPHADADAWSLGFAGGRSTVHSLPVEHMSINLGAPGFRQDAEGNLWIPYPKRVDMGVIGDWLPTYQHAEDMCYRVADQSNSFDGTLSWVYANGYRDQKPLVFRMQDDDSKPARYTVKLHFADPEDSLAGQRVFSVFVQERKVVSDLDLSKQTGGRGKPFVITCRDTVVERDLIIRLAKSEKSSKPALLCGIQAFRQHHQK